MNECSSSRVGALFDPGATRNPTSQEDADVPTNSWVGDRTWLHMLRTSQFPVMLLASQRFTLGLAGGPRGDDRHKSCLLPFPTLQAPTTLLVTQLPGQRSGPRCQAK